MLYPYLIGNQSEFGHIISNMDGIVEVAEFRWNMIQTWNMKHDNTTETIPWNKGQKTQLTISEYMAETFAEFQEKQVAKIYLIFFKENI